MPSDMINIGGFCFCSDHGTEICHECCYDFRATNNIHIQDTLAKLVPNKSPWDIERPAIPSAYTLFSRTGKKDEHGVPIFECKLHKDVACQKGCLDWSKIVVGRMRRIVQDPSSVDVSRQDKIRLLASMGIELSTNTRLPDVTLDKRLQTAIDLSQCVSELVPESPFNLASMNLPNWDSASTDLFKAIQRCSLFEGLKAKVQGHNAFPLYTNPFMDVRQTLMTMSKNWNDGRHHAILQDKDQSHAICIRIVEVRRLREKPDIPVIVVFYGTASRSSPVMHTFQWMTDGLTPQNTSQILATPEEQMLLLTILNLNSKRLSSECNSAYRAKRKTAEKEGVFHLSFLLPMEPLGHEDLGRLTKTEGCVVCGKKTVSKCSGCVVVEYCGAECQKLHWKEHKPLCKTLTGAVFHPVKFNTEPEQLRIANALSIPLETFHVSTHAMNFLRPSENQSDKKPSDPSKPKEAPPNIHGDKPFLVKIQRKLAKESGEMYIYDRQRSFEAFLVRGNASGGKGVEGGWLEGFSSALPDTFPSLVELEKILGEMESIEGKGSRTITDTDAWERAKEQFRLEESSNSAGGNLALGAILFPGKGKIFRFARRIGERELEICWDRKPERDPVW